MGSLYGQMGIHIWSNGIIIWFILISVLEKSVTLVLFLIKLNKSYHYLQMIADQSYYCSHYCSTVFFLCV